MESDPPLSFFCYVVALYAQTALYALFSAGMSECEGAQHNAPSPVDIS
jgi:hypothetical protein